MRGARDEVHRAALDGWKEVVKGFGAKSLVWAASHGSLMEADMLAAPVMAMSGATLLRNLAGWEQ